MSAKLYILGFYLFSLIFVIVLVESNAKDISVSVENGIISGRTETFDGKDVNVFLGIPYAEPPIGDLRFKKPLPAKMWSKAVNASQWPNACFQLPLEVSHMKNKNLSEDCLYLNVFSPNTKSSGTHLKPVMVWIHGGAFMFGSTSEFQYNPLVLSAKGDVLIVSMNYRLSSFGLLYTGTDDAPGNMGFWDQTLALKWVNNNIKNFGGDPKRITIFGESAGSMSVSLHILSPISRDLFQNAIMMSGAGINHGMSAEPKDALKYWVKESKSVGCSHTSVGHNKSDDKFTPKMIECLKKLPANKLIGIPSNVIDSSNGRLDSAKLFVVDGHILTKKAIKMLESGEFKKNLNLMISDTQDEGSLLLTSFVDANKYSQKSPKNFTFSEAYNELKQIAERLDSEKPINGEEVSKLYFTGLSDKTDRDLLRQTIGIAFGDYLITCPTIEFAKTLYENDRKNTNVYQYYFNSKVGTDKLGFCAKWMGVCHANDLPYTFGLPFLQPNLYLDREREISAQMLEFISGFAKTGKPTAVGGVDWPKFYTINNRTIAPFYEITNKPKLVTNFANNLKTDECDYLWRPTMNEH